MRREKKAHVAHVGLIVFKANTRNLFEVARYEECRIMISFHLDTICICAISSVFSSVHLIFVE